MSYVQAFVSGIREGVSGLAAGVAALLLLAAGMALGSFIQYLRDHARLRTERRDAVQKSRAVLGGQLGEQLAPYLSDFPCNPADARFVGKPVDYVAFTGMAEGRPVEEIVFVEVKTGKAQLSPREKEIREAVRKGRVRFAEYRIPAPR